MTDMTDMTVEMRSEHRWLARLVGEWTSEIEMQSSPGGPSETFRGAESVRSLGGVWIVSEGRGPTSDVPTTFMTLGFDPASERFRGSFVASMMTHLWIYDGMLDPATQLLTLDTEGPSFDVEGTMSKYRDTIRLESDDHRILTSSYLGADGAWHQFMTAHYRRAQ